MELKGVIDSLLQWAERQEAVRALLLTSSRANPQATVDPFSDYDVILAVTDIYPFLESDAWLEDFGKVLVVYRDPVQLEFGFEKFCRVTHYQDEYKIDFSVWPVELLRRVVDKPELPPCLDIGYKVLLDKDKLTEGLKPPTYKAYVPSVPTGQDYRAIIDEFFNDSAYVAKNIWRDNLFPMKLSLDHIMKSQCLRKMLEWQMEIDNDWAVKPGAHGKDLKKLVSPEIWSELESTYVGTGREENWEALFKTIEIFRKIAAEVAGHLGYSYPHELDQQVTKYLNKVRAADDQTKNST